MIEWFYMLLLYRNNSRIKKSEMSIGFKSMLSELYWFTICLYYICMKINKYLISKYQVWVRVQQNILNTENKIDKIFVDEVETLWREKLLWGSQTQEIHYLKTKQVTKYSYSQNLLQ